MHQTWTPSTRHLTIGNLIECKDGWLEEWMDRLYVYRQTDRQTYNHVYVFPQAQCLLQRSLQMDQQTVVYGWAVILAAGILNLRCLGWTLMETSSLLEPQWPTDLLNTVMKSRTTWQWGQQDLWPVEFTWHTSTTLLSHHPMMSKVMNVCITV